MGALGTLIGLGTLNDARISSEALATPREIEQWLQQGISAAKAGHLEQARFRLLDVVEQDQTNETAWYWLYQIFDRVDDRRTCLENLILINPQNMWAKRELLALLERTAAPPPAPSPRPKQSRPKPAPPAPAGKDSPAASRPVTLKLVTSFWVGISFIFLGGGIISGLEWLITQNQLGPGLPFPFVDLTVGVIFMMAGVLGLTVAVALYFQSMFGFYGSILLGLGLLLAGPTFSLITSPPNYLAMTCIGGIAGLIVLLTLASLSGFQDTS